MDTERTEKPRLDLDEIERLARSSPGGGLLVSNTIPSLVDGLRACRAELDDTRAQLALYRKAKNENDERFMLERDEARAALADKEREVEALTASLREQDDRTPSARRSADYWLRMTQKAEAALAQRDATIARALAAHAHADTCDTELSPDAGYACSCWRAALGGEPETAEPASRETVAAMYLDNLRKLGASERTIAAAVLAASDEPARCPHGKTNRHALYRSNPDGSVQWCPGPAASGTPEATE